MRFHARVFVVLASIVVVLVAGLSVAPGLTPDTSVHVIPDDIAHRDATCNSSLPDVSAQMQAWLDSLPNNAVAELGVDQCYRLELPVTIGAKTNVRFDGRGSTFASLTDGCAGRQVAKKRFTSCQFPSPDPRAKDWPRGRYHLRIAGNKDVTVENLRIEGGKNRPGYDAAYEAQHGVWITSNDDGVLLDNVTIDHVWGDFVNIAAHHRPHEIATPQDITIRNSHFGLDRPYMGSGRQGVAIGAGENIHVEHNVIQYSSRSAVDIEPLSTGAILREIYFDNNVFGTHGNNLFANHPYGHADPVIDGIYFRWNELIGTTLRVDSVVAHLERINAKDPATFRRHNYQFIGNHSDALNATGGCPDGMWSMRLWGIDGVVVKDNTQPFPKRRCMHLLEEAKVRDSRVTGNTARDAASITKRYYQSFNVCESDNYTGRPLSRERSRIAPACT